MEQIVSLIFDGTITEAHGVRLSAGSIPGAKGNHAITGMRRCVERQPRRDHEIEVNSDDGGLLVFLPITDHPSRPGAVIVPRCAHQTPSRAVLPREFPRVSARVSMFLGGES